ncbi:Elongation factor 1-gamma 1 [Borealophlyctis nickersoniae]|nr:Elongation factor 1-gamma 1 [Borealophlyctis nickersoniae]
MSQFDSASQSPSMNSNARSKEREFKAEDMKREDDAASAGHITPEPEAGPEISPFPELRMKAKSYWRKLELIVMWPEFILEKEEYSGSVIAKKFLIGKRYRIPALGNTWSWSGVMLSGDMRELLCFENPMKILRFVQKEHIPPNVLRVVYELMAFDQAYNSPLQLEEIRAQGLLDFPKPGTDLAVEAERRLSVMRSFYSPEKEKIPGYWMRSQAIHNLRKGLTADGDFPFPVTPRNNSSQYAPSGRGEVSVRKSLRVASVKPKRKWESDDEDGDDVDYNPRKPFAEYPAPSKRRRKNGENYGPRRNGMSRRQGVIGSQDRNVESSGPGRGSDSDDEPLTRIKENLAAAKDKQVPLNAPVPLPTPSLPFIPTTPPTATAAERISPQQSLPGTPVRFQLLEQRQYAGESISHSFWGSPGRDSDSGSDTSMASVSAGLVSRESSPAVDNETKLKGKVEAKSEAVREAAIQPVHIFKEVHVDIYSRSGKCIAKNLCIAGGYTFGQLLEMLDLPPLDTSKSEYQCSQYDPSHPAATGCNYLLRDRVGAYIINHGSVAVRKCDRVKIYTYPNNPRVAKVLIAAAYNGLKVDEVHINIGTDNKTAEFLSKFPLGKLPTFETNDGFYLYESNAIAYYVASLKDGTTLLGKDKKERALIEQFIALADNEIASASTSWLGPIYGWFPYNEQNTKKAQEDIKRVLTVLNQHLLKKTFFVGETVTLADIVLACSLIQFYRMVFDPTFRAPFRNLNRWFNTIVNQPNFKNVLGEVVLAEKMAVPEKKKAEKKEKAPAAPKAEKKKAEKKEKEADEEEEPSYADEKPKEKNPLDLLPASKFNLEAWKRFYSNNDTRPTAINWFWDNYDPAGFSIWKAVYKYNDELTQVWLSSNLVGGIMQRLDRARKYAFGNLLVLGEDNNSVISGYFVFRGHDIPAEVRDVADFESYNWTRVNDQDKAVREEFDAYLAWDEKIEGRKFADGKTFK